MAPRYALFWSITVCLAVYLLAACAVAPERHLTATFNDCDGVEHTIPVARIETYCVPCECGRLASELGGEWWQVALMTVGLPIACSIWDYAYTFAFIVLPPSPPEWLEAHEWAHVRYHNTHPALLPLWPGDDCGGKS